MNLINDYFLLYHGITFDQDLDERIIDISITEDILSIFALIISTTRNNYEKFLSLTSFKTLCEKLDVEVPLNICELNYLQYNIINTILKNKTEENITTLNLAFEYLKDEDIINSENYNKLISLFEIKDVDDLDEQKLIEKNKNEHKSTFKDLKINLENIILDLKASLSNKEVLEELENTKNYLNNQKFSIGITGVMNAGKSTMLNALMGREILGSAVVPETANLTIVKYNKTDIAKVYYWNEQEWNKIINSSLQLESMKEFVDETKKIFGDNLKNYIRTISRFDEIDIKDLSSYTSAEASGKKCNLVKYVELGSKLTFLSDGIEIVDTPGLDDPVIQREEITKEYISKCDMMLHLMNVSQSATLKDVEFIIDALLYQNVSKLLIVITRADTVSKEQLEEVIKYTKSSIEKQLIAQNKDSKLEFILKSIKFIPISGKMALMHRTGNEKEALTAGFTIEDTGILEVEKYLMETLFGNSSQKGELIVQSTKNQLQKIIEKQISFNNYELTLLSKSKDELKLELVEFNKKKATNLKAFQTLSEDIAYYKNDAESYIDSLGTFLESELIELQTVIRQRVINDVRYSFEKDKKRPQNQRIKVIVQTAIKDGIIDIIRDYRYKFIKKSQTIGEQCEQKYQGLGLALGHKNENFDARGFFQDDFKSGFLTSNDEVFVSQIIEAVSNSKDSKINELDKQIESLISMQFSPIENDIKIKAKKMSEMLIDSFFTTLNTPLKTFEQKLKNDEETLQKQLNSFEKNDKNRDKISIDILKNIKKLENISQMIKGLN